MPSIQYISNGVTCCIPLSTTQSSHPSLSVYNNGTQYYAAMTTAALSGVHVCNNGINYSIGAPEEEGGVRIHSNYVCIACAYNYNTVMCVCFCTDDDDYEFELGLNPTYGTSASGWATVTWNSKNCTGTSPTIEEHFCCMCAHSTAANAITYWGTTLPACWNYVNACIAAGCDLDPKDGSSVLYTSYTICVNDNCYWSQDSDFCYSRFSNHAAWSSCSWCKGCKPIGCWTSVEYASYNMNRTSGNLHIWGGGPGGDGCLLTANNVTSCCWSQCPDDSCGCWLCEGSLCRTYFPAATFCIEGSVPSTITICSPGTSYCNANTDYATLTEYACSFTWSSGRYMCYTGTGTLCGVAPSGMSPRCWVYKADTNEYVCACICASCWCQYYGYNYLCVRDSWSSPICVITYGHWTDGSSCLSISATRSICIVPLYTSGACDVSRCVCSYSYLTPTDYIKYWQNWTAPTLVHCAW